MRSICSLSRRWHQQFCLSPSFGGHYHCLQAFQPPRPSIREIRHLARDRGGGGGPGGGPGGGTRADATGASKSKPRYDPTPKPPQNRIKVREYEQLADDNSTRIRVPDLISAEGRKIHAEMLALDEELVRMRQGPFGPQSEFMQSLPPDERERVLRELGEAGLLQEEDDLITDEELEDLVNNRDPDDRRTRKSSGSELQVTLSIPRTDKIYVKRFNAALDAAQQAPADPQKQLDLWKWYRRTQQHVSNFANILPDDVWHFLWRSQSTVYYRPTHLRLLAQDMIKAETELEDQEWIQYISALREDGELATAAGVWEQQRHRIGHREAVAAQFWQLGVEIYVSLGKPRKAQNLAFDCYEHTVLIKPELLANVISAWAGSKGEFAAERAWFCYLELRRRLENTETDESLLRVLGQITSSLLSHGRTQLALAVFKDMFLLKFHSPEDSWKIFQSISATGAKPPSAPNEDLICHIGLSTLAALPRTFQNKFFYASWIKWLLGEGNVDSATMVVDLMYERNVRPDARHINGLIAAWLRQGSADSIEKALDTAWAMVQARIDLVASRQEPSSPSRPRQHHYPSFLHRSAPPATIETFSILIQYYTRHDLDRAAEVTDILTGSASMKPNSFIMNHWLYASLRSGDIADVWNKYAALKQTVAPDLETFAALWDTCKVHLTSTHGEDNSFPGARVLFGEMKDWLSGLDTKTSKSVSLDFSSQLYEQIIRCFCLSSDSCGTLLAMHDLERTFSALPHGDITRLVLMQVARSFDGHPGQRTLDKRRRRRQRDLELNGMVKSLGEILTGMMVRKIDDGSYDGREAEEVESPTAQALRFDVLSSFIGMVLEKNHTSEESSLVSEIQEVANVMKVDVESAVEVLKKREWEGMDV